MVGLKSLSKCRCACAVTAQGDEAVHASPQTPLGFPAASPHGSPAGASESARGELLRVRTKLLPARLAPTLVTILVHT